MDINSFSTADYLQIVERFLRKNGVTVVIVAAMLLLAFFFQWAIVGALSTLTVLGILQLNSNRSRLLAMSRSVLGDEIRSLTALRHELGAATEAARETVGSALHITSEKDVLALSHAQALIQLIDQRIAALSALCNARSVRQVEFAQTMACSDLVLKADCTNSFVFGQKDHLTVSPKDLSNTVRRAVYQVNRAAREMPRWQSQPHRAA